MTKALILVVSICVFCCKSKTEKITPTIEDISESIYASGLLKSKNQYDAFVTVSGTIDHIYVDEGDSVKVGTPILSIYNKTQTLTTENANLLAEYTDYNANRGKLNEATLQRTLAKDKLKNDSLMFYRQKALWAQNIGTKVELEQRELAFSKSKSLYYSAYVNYKDLQRQIDFTAAQAKKNVLITASQKDEYLLRSEINGIVFSILKSRGEVVNPQTILAVIGEKNSFVLEMQVDEYDILNVKIGLDVFVTMDSYKTQVFKAKVTKINPLMNEHSKTFLVEAQFVKNPKVLYPNTSFEANIVIRTKQKALLIPRNYLLNDSLVIKVKHDTVTVKTGLKDYKKVEIISGISVNDELVKP